MVRALCIIQVKFIVLCFVFFQGNPSQPTSLHYMSPYQMNAYAMALKAVGEIIQDYDSDKFFPAYGFGAKLPPDGKISHVFPLVRQTYVLLSLTDTQIFCKGMAFGINICLPAGVSRILFTVPTYSPDD